MRFVLEKAKIESYILNEQHFYIGTMMKKPFLHSLLLSLILSNAACAMTVTHDTKTHTESITEMHFEKPFGSYGVSDIKISLLPPVVKGVNYISFYVELTLQNAISKEEFDTLLPKLYTEKLPDTLLVSSATSDEIPQPLSIGIKTHFPLMPHTPSGEVSFESNLAKIKDLLKRYFSIDDEVMAEIETMLEEEKTKRMEALKDLK